MTIVPMRLSMNRAVERIPLVVIAIFPLLLILTNAAQPIFYTIFFRIAYTIRFAYSTVPALCF